MNIGKRRVAFGIQRNSHSQPFAATEEKRPLAATEEKWLFLWIPNAARFATKAFPISMAWRCIPCRQPWYNVSNVHTAGTSKSNVNDILYVIIYLYLVIPKIQDWSRDTLLNSSSSQPCYISSVLVIKWCGKVNGQWLSLVVLCRLRHSSMLPGCMPLLYFFQDCKEATSSPSVQSCPNPPESIWAAPTLATNSGILFLLITSGH